jgi:hypothetical protein
MGGTTSAALLVAIISHDGRVALLATNTSCCSSVLLLVELSGSNGTSLWPTKLGLVDVNDNNVDGCENEVSEQRSDRRRRSRKQDRSIFGMVRSTPQRRWMATRFRMVIESKDRGRGPTRERIDERIKRTGLSPLDEANTSRRLFALGFQRRDATETLARVAGGARIRPNLLIVQWPMPNLARLQGLAGLERGLVTLFSALAVSVVRKEFLARAPRSRRQPFYSLIATHEG